MREAHPGRRSAHDKGVVSLASHELNAGPPVFRTLIVLDTIARTRQSFALSPDDQRHIASVRDLHIWLRALSDRFWGGVRADVRTLAFDYDNHFLLHSGPPYIPGLRDRPGPAYNTTSSRIGLTEAQKASLSACWHAAHKTDAYAAASAAAARIRLHDSLRRRMVERLSVLNARAQAAYAEERPLGDIARNIGEIREAAYDDADEDVRRAAMQIKAFHELVQHLMWALLGFAEQEPGKIATLTVGLPRTSVRHRWRMLDAQFTTSDVDSLGFPQTGGPFQVVGRGPLDGVYVCIGFNAALGEALTFDVTGRLIRELERAPVDF
jgi:hypothetical protein